MKRFFLTVLTAVVVSTTAMAQERPHPEIGAPAIPADMDDAAIADGLESWLSDLNRNGVFNGVVLVARDGREIYAGAHGVASLEPEVALSADTRFPLASIGKFFTRAAVLRLIQSGRLAPETTIGDVIPDYPQAVSRSATVAQLLDHTGGVANIFGPAFMNADMETFSSNHAYYTFVAGQPPTFAPGEGEEYCNGCYVVLGEMIERISGMPYEQFVTEQVLSPGGMTRAGFFRRDRAPDDTAAFLGRPRPDLPLQDVASWHGVAGSGAGNVYATARDLLAFDNAVRDQRLFDAAFTARLLQGPQLGEGRALVGFGVAGGAPGINTVLNGDGVWTVIVLANNDPPIAEAVADAVFPLLTRADRP